MGFLEERDLSSVPSIPEYYKGKTIFITGGSGFMGKILIEKLLYSCTDLDRIYLLLRTKKGVKSEDRIEQLYSAMCFDRLRKERPGVFESKVFVVAGDAADIGLGLSDDDRTLIINRVNIVFHVAASVRFDDPLTYAGKLNLRGTKEVVDLCKEIRNLSAFVHVSTLYTNTNRKEIDEVMYPPHADWRDTLRVCETIDEHTLRILTPKYLGDIPNTYTFTKQLAEHVVYEEVGKLPAVIIRPSIVISSAEEPFPGWVENFNGPVGLLIACGKGIMRSIYSHPDIISDYVPVDVSIKNIIAAGWIRGTKSLETTDDITIYNCCAGQLNTITISALLELGKKIIVTMPFNDTLWNVGGCVTEVKLLHYLKVIFLHLLPALFVDGILLVLGKEPMLLKIQRRIYIATMELRYFVTQQWIFIHKNFILLRSCIKEEDKKDFYYELETIDRHQFLKAALGGCKKYLLKEKEEDLPKAKAHYKRMVIIDYAFRFLFFGYIFWWIMNTNLFQNLCQDLGGFF